MIYFKDVLSATNLLFLRNYYLYTVYGSQSSAYTCGLSRLKSTVKSSLDLGKQRSANFSDRASGVSMIVSKELLEAISVKAISKNELEVEFSNQTKKIINLDFLVQNPPPVFVKLQDESQFRKVTVNMVGGISWDCGADLSADYLFSK